MNNQYKLSELIAGIVEPDYELALGADVTVNGVQLDSRLIRSGDLFLATFGSNHDARDYIADTIERGAAAVLAESGGAWQGLRYINSVPVLAVDGLAGKISALAGRFYGDPSHRLNVIGITGTNGKTSCSQFTAQALDSLGYRCGCIGTLGYGAAGRLKETQLTTPDPVFTQRVLAEMVDDQLEPVAMEVSSVGLHQKRVAAVRFDTAVFTNLSRDHLDYHGSMEEYAETKKKLFRMPGLCNAVVNLDDSYALRFINGVARDVDITTFSVNNPVATVHAEQLQLTPTGYQAVMVTPMGRGEIKGRLFGSFNFSNVLAVAATLIAYLGKRGGIELERLCTAIGQLQPVNGRMDIVGTQAGVTAIVDYAHTPDGLRSALLALREHFSGKTWCVFGCGGNRDRGKRPMMGEVAEAYADHLVITDDNPRRESADGIVQDILDGLTRPEAAKVIRNRAEAIEYAVTAAAPGDVVLVAGKGHENYQDIAGNRIVFSDASQVRLALQQRPAVGAKQ